MFFVSSVFSSGNCFSLFIDEFLDISEAKTSRSPPTLYSIVFTTSLILTLFMNTAFEFLPLETFSNPRSLQAYIVFFEKLLCDTGCSFTLLQYAIYARNKKLLSPKLSCCLFALKQPTKDFPLYSMILSLSPTKSFHVVVLCNFLLI